MNDTTELIVEVVKVEPVAVYKDTVYDQTVVAQLHDRTKINLYDITATVENNRVGDTLNLSVHVLPLPSNDVRTASEESMGIYSPTNPSNEWNYDFVGEIIDIDLDDNLITLNVGAGIVAVDITELNSGMTESIKSDDVISGDQLYVPGRADLIRVN